MKRFYIFLLAACAAVTSWAGIPAGTTIYLDATQHWCCHQSYFVYFSADRAGQPAGAYRMTADPQHPGVYYYTTTAQAESQNNVRFCYSDSHPNLYYNNQVGTHTEDVAWNSTSKPYYVIDSDNGKTGHWAAAPSVAAATGFNQDPQAIVTYDCSDSIYIARLYATFTGTPCGLKVESSLLPQTETKALPQSPFELLIDTIRAQQGDVFTVTFTLCSDRGCSTPIDGQVRTLTISIPEAKCTETTSIDTCYGTTLTLTSNMPSATLYEWTINGVVDDNLRDRSITITTDSMDGVNTYEVFAYRTQITASKNLMANGGFETNETILSDYTNVGRDQTDYYTSNPGADNLFGLTKNANQFWHDFVAIKPHSGQYFALFDAGKSGFAWKATSNDNPSLMVRKDSTYYFSYWAATPNVTTTSPARLQFVISTDGGTTFSNLGPEYVLPTDDNEWHQQFVTWQSPVTSVDVVIGVMDRNADHDGNDFCLDDIMFQTVKYEEERIAFTNTFIITQHDCDVPPCTVPLYRKWSDFLHVDNSKSTYNHFQWYRNDERIEGATLPYLDLTQLPNLADTDVYYVLLSTSDGQQLESCHSTFSQAKIWQAQPKTVVSRRRIVLSTQLSVVVTTYDDGSVDTEKQIKF